MPSRAYPVVVLLLVAFAVTTSFAKPKLKVASDGFPAGRSTPEGAASDLARAFIERDGVSFRSVCIRPYGRGHARAAYVEYLIGVSDHFKRQNGTASDEPTKILRVFAARHLSRRGPASYGYAAFNFQDVMFVDVEVMLRTGNTHLRRTMVIKDGDGKWFAHPVPDVSPLLSAGLYQESASTLDFTDAYEIER